MHSSLIAAVLALALVGGSSEPKITGVLPEKITTSAKPLQVTISGQDFRSGLALAVTTPGGEARSFSGADISGLTAALFRVSVAFDAVGTYEFVVINADGGKSPPFRIDVKAGAKPPWIDRIMPAEAARSQEAQVFTLRGGNFEPGLKLSVTDPTGTVTVKDVFDRLEPTILVLGLTLEVSGTYSVSVTNPSGAASNSVSVTVR